MPHSISLSGDKSATSLRIFVFTQLYPPHILRQHALVSFLPADVSRRADPGLTAEIRHQHAVCAPLQDEPFRAAENFEDFIGFHSSRPWEGQPKNSGFKRSGFQGSHHQAWAEYL
nr:hypothetical protein [Falsigemmobacter faecalis]